MKRDRSPQARKPGVKHGTTSGYSNGCRCEACRTAASAYWRRQRARRTPPKPQPVPLGPLLERLSSHLGVAVEQLSQDDIAEACGVTPRTACRWRSCGWIAERYADRIAVHLGWHPAAIWGADWWIETTQLEGSTT